LDWCPDILTECKAIIIDSFRRGNYSMPSRVPVAWALPTQMGGLLFPTTHSLQNILRKTKLTLQFSRVIGLPAWERQATLRKFSGMNSRHGTGKGAAIPSLTAMEAVHGGFTGVPDTTNDQPLLASSAVKYYLDNPHVLAPATGYTWNVIYGKRAPSVEQVDLILTELGYSRADTLDANSLRRATLEALVTGDIVARASIQPLSGRRGSSRIYRILHGVSQKYPLDRESWDWCVREWLPIIKRAKTLLGLSEELSKLLGAIYLPPGNLQRFMLEDSFPWSFRLS
jgi:hypothetical protein